MHDEERMRAAEVAKMEAQYKHGMYERPGAAQKPRLKPKAKTAVDPLAQHTPYILG